MDPYKRLELLLPRVMSPDRFIFRKELKYLIQRSRKYRSKTEERKRLHKIEQKINISIQKKEWRRRNIPEFSFDRNLPIYAKKSEIIEAIKNNNIVIISGETGSGKTTQIPKFCLAAGRGINGVIGCTQPRRIAAISVANRIAEELGENIGKSTGYKIRFEEKIGENPYIKIMTDGILLAETQNDPFLNYYDTIIVDEAHERSLNIDFVLGILKNLLTKRRDLKLIITSATIDTKKFSIAFNNAPVIEVSGKMYPVEIRYHGVSIKDIDNGAQDYTERAVDAAISLLNESQSSNESHSGDILIFMPTEQDIRETCELLEKKNKNSFVVFPLFARLPASQQKQIFSLISKRKIIISTNIAETSLTIPNISYVIDTGLARISEYSPSSGTVSLPVKAISKSSADQRMGRCGRIRDGICVRLYDKEDYEGRTQFTMPEIFRINLAEVILKTTAFRLGDISGFPFVDKPKQQAISDGYNTLLELGAIQKDNQNKYFLTDKGRLMARLPIDPRLSRMLIEAHEKKCLKEILAIASMLSVQDPMERPTGKENEADEKHAEFVNRSSDFITLLNIWNRFSELYDDNKSRSKIRKYCRENYLSYNRMKEIREIHAQLSMTIEENGITIKKTRIRRRDIKEFDPVYNAIHKSILAGFLSNIANRKSNNFYNATKQREVMIFPGSGLFGKGKEWIVCAELVRTSQLFARTAANISADWIEEIASQQCEYSYRDPYWDRGKGDVYAFEHVSLYGLEIVRNRRIAYGRINPIDATATFIREALVEDIITQIGLDSAEYMGNETALFQLEREFPFMQHNIKLIRKFLKIENRIRKKVMISRDDLYMFYADRIHNAYNTNTLDALIKENKGDDFLFLKEENLLASVPDYDKIKNYPEVIAVNNIVLDIDYRFEPGSWKDGVTVKIPVSIIQSINMHFLESQIPGLYREKITELIKNLPKQYRRHLVPVANTVEMIFREMSKDNPLIISMSKFLHDKYNIEIPENAWKPGMLPDHLKLRISIIDKDGREIKSGREPEILIQELIEELDADVFYEIKKSWERENINEWNFGDLPESIHGKNKNGLYFAYYPGLAVEDGKLSLRIFKNRDSAVSSHKAGIAELTARELSDQLEMIKNDLIIPDELIKTTMLFGGSALIRENWYKKIIRDHFHNDIRTKQDFDNNVKIIRESVQKLGNHIHILLIDTLENYGTAIERFGILKSQNKAIRSNIVFLNKLEDELNSLVPRDFLLIYDDNELASLGKYIKALSIRAERGCANLQKDNQKEKEIALFKQALDHEYSVLPPDVSREKLQALRTYFWLIEEYKISVFAPEIKSRIKISGKRLEQTMEEIKGMR